jgi:erythromycin esterase-like protein
MGEEYYAFSLEFNQGAFHTRTLLSGNLLGDLKEVILPPAPKGSFPWYLSQINFDKLILDLRAPLENPVVKQWLDAPQKVVLAGWVHPGDSRDFITTVDLRRSFDGIIYIDKTTASRPTKNALKSIARREGL